MSYRVTALIFAASFSFSTFAADPSLKDIQPAPPVAQKASSSLPARVLQTRPLSNSSVKPLTKSVSLEAKSILWNKDLQAGRAKMIKTEQPMMLFVTAPSCQYCELMKETTFNQKWIVQHINAKFTPVMINGREEKAIADKLRIRFFPATAVVHPNGKVVEIARGYKSPSEFLKYLAIARTKLKLEQKKLATTSNAAPHVE